MSQGASLVAGPFNAVQQGNGCSVCSGLAAKTPADYVALAAERDFQWQGPEVANTSAKSGWLCPERSFLLGLLQHDRRRARLSIVPGHGERRNGLKKSAAAL